MATCTASQPGEALPRAGAGGAPSTGGVCSGPVAAECEVDDCGVVAVGRCGDCRQAFCTSHQAFKLSQGGLVAQRYPTNRCTPCELVADAKSVTSAAEARRRMVEEPVADLMAVTDLSERTVLAVGRHAQFGVHSKGMNSPVLDRVLRSTYPAWPGDKRPWNGDEIARWFARSASKRGLRPPGFAAWDTYRRGGPFGGKIRKTSVTLPAWTFRQQTIEGRRREDQHVFEDGRWSPSRENDHDLKWRETKHYSLSPSSLSQMYHTLRLDESAP